MSLRFRHAVVVGASSGIGASIARMLAADGCTVALLGRREAELQRVVASLPAGARPIPVVHDVTDQTGVPLLFERLVADHFDERRVPGTFVLYEPGAHRYRACNESRARIGYLPASTFKIANALVALETGALADENELFRWDGKPKLRAACERDHTLATGMKESVVWMFQRIARRIGKARMKEWLARMEYGNADTGGGIDHFWLQGSLRTSAVEQVDFLRRLEEGRLPVGARARRLVREALFHSAWAMP